MELRRLLIETFKPMTATCSCGGPGSARHQQTPSGESGSRIPFSNQTNSVFLNPDQRKKVKGNRSSSSTTSRPKATGWTGQALLTPAARRKWCWSPSASSSRRIADAAGRKPPDRHRHSSLRAGRIWCRCFRARERRLNENDANGVLPASSSPQSRREVVRADAPRMTPRLIFLAPPGHQFVLWAAS